MKKYLLIAALPLTLQARTLYGVVVGCPKPDPKSAPCQPHVKYVAADTFEKASKLAMKGEKEDVKFEKFESLGELSE